jgi:hypothetical protein
MKGNIMAGFIKIEVEKLETQQVNTEIPFEIFNEFQKRCKIQNIPMNVVFESFCRQYANGKYLLNEYDIMKWKNYDGKTSTLNTPINKQVYDAFKHKVKAEKYFVKHILSAFIEEYGLNELCFEIVRENSTNYTSNFNIDENISRKHLIDIVPKGHFRCPKCEKIKEATSEKAILLKFPN